MSSCFIDCPVVFQFWHMLVCPCNKDVFFNANLRNWLLLNLCGGTDCGLVFGHVVYFLWLAGNKEPFKHATPSSESYHSFGSFDSSSQLTPFLSPYVRERHTLYVGWQPLEKGGLSSIVMVLLKRVRGRLVVVSPGI